MADLIIKPNSATGDKLILQDRAGGAVLTTADSGAAITNISADMSPLVDNAVDLGSASKKWRSIYTTDATIPAITGDTSTTGHFTPSVDNSKDLGSATKRWRNIYTTDLHLNNDRGDWTIIEEKDYLTLRNNKTDKVYKLVMEEIE